MPKRPLIEMPEIEEKKISTSFKFTEPTVERIKDIKKVAKNLGAKNIYLDDHVEEKVHDVLDNMEILLSDHGHLLDERLTKKKVGKKAAAAERKTKTPPPIPPLVHNESGDGGEESDEQTSSADGSSAQQELM